MTKTEACIGCKVKPCSVDNCPYSRVETPQQHYDEVNKKYEEDQLKLKLKKRRKKS